MDFRRNLVNIVRLSIINAPCKSMVERKPNASLDSVSFDASKYHFQGDADGKRTWFTPAGDAISVLYFPTRPGLPAPAHTIFELERFYRERVCSEQVRMTEFSLLTAADMPAIWMILKVSLKPSGLVYLGSLTLPFADFSFVVKMQCIERGIAGMRETALLLEAQQDGRVTIGEDGKISGDWNPDAAMHDEKFPDHPVSRLRFEFARIISSLQLTEATKSEARFELPTPTTGQMA